MSEEKGFYSFRENGHKYGSFALELVPGNKCQLHCKNCYKGDALPGDMSDNFVFNVIQQAKNLGFAEIVLIGGEPTLHKSLPKFMKFILETGLDPILVTNGIKLSDADYADSIALPGVILVLHAPLPAYVQNQHAQKSDYNHLLLQAYENILGKKDVKVVAEVTILDEFIPHLENTYKWCLDHGVIPFFEISRQSDNGKHYHGDSSPEMTEEIFRLLSKIDPNQHGPLLPPAFGQPRTMSITGLHVKNFGGGDFGGVYSCCAQKIKHGDLLQDSLSEIIQQPSLEIFMNQDEWITGPCKSCEHYSVCRGGCRGEAFLAYGCPRASYPCWHIPAEVRNDHSKMRPESCDGCPLQNDPSCGFLTN